MGLLNMALRNIMRKSTRTLLVSLALCFAIASIISVYSGTEASNADTKQMIAEYQDTLMEVGELTNTQESMIQVSIGRGGFGGGGGFWGGGGTAGGEAVLTETELVGISGVENVEAVIPKITKNVGDVDWEQMRKMREEMRESGQGMGQGREDMRTFMDSLFDYTIQGIPLDDEFVSKYSLLPEKIVKGSTLTDTDTGSVLIRDSLTSFFSGGVGDNITIEGQQFTVKGLYESDDTRKNVYMNVADAQAAIDMVGQYSTFDVYVSDKSYVDLAVYDISELYPDLSVQSYAELSERINERINTVQEEQIASLEADNEKVEDTGTQIIVISTATAGLIVLFMMFYTVKERTKEIGIFKALGFQENRIMNQFIAEGAIIGFIGGIFGVAIGWAGAPFLADLLLPSSSSFASIKPSVGLIILGLGLAAALGILGSIIPAWRASRKSPAEAIRG